MIEKIRGLLTADLSGNCYAEWIESCAVVCLALIMLIIFTGSMFSIFDCLYYGRF